VKLSEIRINERNPRKISQDQLEKLKESLKRDPEFMDLRPIVVDGDGVVMGGNQRYKGLLELGYAEVPDSWVVKADNLSPEKLKRFILVDNAPDGMSGEWDFELLAEDWEMPELGDLGFDLEAMGFDADEETEGLTDDDEVPEVPVVPVSKRGDIWLCGEHRVMCGDSTSAEDVGRLMDGKKADMVFTDPPYGVKRDKGFEGFGGFGGKGKPIARRRYKDDWDSGRPGAETFALILGSAVHALIFGGNYFADLLPQGKHWIVWDKKNTMPTFGDCELVWTNIKRDSVKLKQFEYNGLIGKEKERFHPTQKPVMLFVDLIEEYSAADNMLCDFYLGSGSTLIACEKTNRICYGMEISEQYVDVIINRWQDFTGKQAVHAETGELFDDRR
jgi:DNA modification methylase